jgi:2Fe-2S ferredoxin
MPRLIVIDAGGVEHPIEAACGLSVMQVARMHGLGVEGTCDGSLACATCHVVVHPDHAGRLKPASEEEEDMLDLAFGLKPTSRLGCQIVMSDELDGLVVTIPKGL